MLRALKWLLFIVVVVAALAAAWLYSWTNRPLDLPSQPFTFVVEKGSGLKALSRKLTEAGLLPEPTLFWLLGRVTEQTAIQAGTYRLDAPLTPRALLTKLVDGDVVKVSLTIVEGVTFAEMRALVEKHPDVRVTLRGVPAVDILKRIGAPESHPEGLFFPDTYQFAAGITDIELYRSAYTAMQKRVNEAWAQRAPDLPYKSPYEMLIMASIIEKETGRADERPLIASVFINRLRIPMRLQTDPTVIYGMGARFDGNIRKRDLTADTPYNTYTRDGLPPTPIALPGAGSLLAATQPEKSEKLYFVATRKGDGSHYFSSTLAEHNRAVAKYQLGR